MAKKPRKPVEAHVKAAAERAIARTEGRDPLVCVSPEPEAARAKPRKEPKARIRGSAKTAELSEELVEEMYEITPHTIKRGRPTTYKPEYAKRALELCKLGAIDAELADAFDVDVRTIPRWAAQYPAFCQALKTGKDAADERVERSLFQLAVGYEMDVVKITSPQVGMPKIIRYKEKVAPNTTACIFWLKNRRKAEWRDKQEMEHSGQVDLNAIRDALTAKVGKS